jgi:3-isopropylmalate/(R)-2-methylmalate dehydratase small subunit
MSDYKYFFFPMPFERFSSRAIRIPRKDIDTDLIIPAKYLKVTDTSGLQEGCFAELKKDPDFPMNRAEFADATIILAGANFGCGSSREHAPWALTQSGIKAVISSEFADIFKGNAEKNGLLPIQLSSSDMKELFATDELSEITVDLEHQKVIAEEKEYSFDISKFSKIRFLQGLSDVDYLSLQSDKIRRFEEKRSGFIPVL